MPDNADAIIIGAGLAGLVTAAELVEAGKRVIILEQEPEASFGGQAWWSFGGLFLIDSPEQRRMGVKDSHELARQDWFASAEFDRAEDDWARGSGQRPTSRSPPARSAKWLKAKGRVVLPRRRMGRTRWLHRHRPWQLRAALPHHLGHRPRRARPVHQDRARRRRGGPRGAALPSPRRQAAHPGQHGHRRRGRDPRPRRRRARTGEQPRGGPASSR